MKQRNFYILLVYLFSMIAFIFFLNHDSESVISKSRSKHEIANSDDYRREIMYKADSAEKAILSFLYKLSAFAVDIDLLNDFKKHRLNSLFDLNFEKYLQLSQIKHNGRAVFGIFEGVHVNNFTNYNFDSAFNINCVLVNVAKDTLIDRQVTTNIFLKCRKYFIQLAVFYKRGEDFLWIGKSGSSGSDKALWFGDTARAVNRFTLFDVIDANFNTLKFPNDTDLLTFDYPHSQFLECNRTLAKNIHSIYPNYSQDDALNERIAPCMAHISKTFESLRKHYWLAAGTLLGWYRQCGIIPFTHDIDFGILSHDLDKNLRKKFMGTKPVRTWLTLGVISNSFEIRTSGCGFTYDMLVFYRRNSTTQCNSFHTSKIFSTCFPIFDDLCSAEMLNHKFMIPCRPIEYLNTQYGVNGWQEPKVDNYQVTNTDWMIGRNYSETELKYSYRYYDENGKLNTKASLDAINSVYSKYYGQNLTQLPNDDYLYL